MNSRDEDQTNMGTPLRNVLKRIKASEDGSKIWDKEQKEMLLFKIEELLKKLKRAKRRKSSDASPHDARNMSIEVLVAVMHSLIWMPDIHEERLLQPLYTLMDALVDFQKGRDPSLFSRSPKGRGRKVEPTDRRMMRIIAASATEVLMKSGLSLNDATSWVARRLNKAGWSKTGTDKKIKPGTVARWRDDQVEAIRRDKHVEPLWFLFKGYQKVKVSSKADAEKLAQNLINWLTDNYFLSIEDSS